MDYLPLFFDVKGKPCLIVGGGAIALRKARLLVKAHADIKVIALKVCAELRELVNEAGGEIIEREYQSEDITRLSLVIAATDNHPLNAQISSDAQAANVPVNVVDSPELCTVITPAIIDRSPLIIGVSSGGRAPVLARMARAKIEALLPSSYGQLAQLASRLREKVKSTLGEGDQRRYFWERMFEGRASELALSGRIDDAEALMVQELALTANTDQAASTGEVYLVGGGPGDPDLLTFKALRLMQQADVVLYDRLVSEGVMELVRRDADRIYVGKKRSDHSVPQQDINQLLVDLASKGKRVLRLKGGDPFIVGRGGEEIETLAENGIPFQVVPGITAASGCAAYSGIPLTHRDYAQSVRFITGHLKDDSTNINWAELIDPAQTLVFYMSLKGLETICKGLIQHGRDASTPAALVEKGTTQAQRVFTGTLENLHQQVLKNQVRAPTLLIIGGVVELQEKLSWFNTEH
jgi:uroporphyrin-III C-methyltransferase/precorrin-2 dehydrogenase/sirohydrochlorin ferrochelatase